MRATVLALAGAALLAAACAPRVSVSWPAAQPAASVPTAAGESDGAAPNVRTAPPTGQEPVQILSSRMTYRQQGRVTVFEGRVRVRQGTLHLAAPYLEVHSEAGWAEAKNGVRLTDHARGLTVTARTLTYRKQLADATARGRVILETHDDDGMPLRAASDWLHWDQEQLRAEAGGGVRIHYRNLTATATGMHYDRTRQRLDLLGPPEGAEPQPAIRQDDNDLRGDRIVLHLDRRSYEVTGRAFGSIVPEEHTAAAPGAEAETAP